jgi:hypothetical protein
MIPPSDLPSEPDDRRGILDLYDRYQSRFRVTGRIEHHDTAMVLMGLLVADAKALERIVRTLPPEATLLSRQKKSAANDVKRIVLDSVVAEISARRIIGRTVVRIGTAAESVVNMLASWLQVRGHAELRLSRPPGGVRDALVKSDVPTLVKTLIQRAESAIPAVHLDERGAEKIVREACRAIGMHKKRTSDLDFVSALDGKPLRRRIEERVDLHKRVRKAT